MILPDINLLVYAYNRDAPHHAAAKAWWEGLLSGTERVGLPWVVACGFIRLMTHPAVLVSPKSPGAAVAHVRSWMAQPVVEVIEPGPRHLEILESVLTRAGGGGNLTTDAHLAAKAIEHQAEIHTNDAEFTLFPGVRVRNPLEG